MIKKFICKFCKCQVVSSKDLHPVLGKAHGKHCPRKRFN